MCKNLRLWLLLVSAVALGGCYENNDVTLYEPGVYKGKSDPLLATDASARADQLQTRFQTIQTDR